MKLIDKVKTGVGEASNLGAALIALDDVAKTEKTLRLIAKQLGIPGADDIKPVTLKVIVVRKIRESKS